MRRPTTCAVGLALAAAVAAALLPAGHAVAAPARGTIAVLNVGAGGWEVAVAAGRQLARHVGGWARQPSIAAFLAGRPNPGALPAGHVGLELTALVDRVRRERRPSADDLFSLGRLLAVDYLLLLQLRKRGLAARLYSVHRQRYAPQGYEGGDQQVAPLEGYLRAQTAAGPQRLAVGRSSRWWIWAAAAAAAVAVAVIAVASGGDDRTGDLTIRVERR